ncbi:guanine nucleotide-binding protein G(q) subunit alpha-like [Zootermopsis nevadensis]|uniref:Guanine nucleotide-binding protein subunit alpha n=1 Tax=Zootermopsis nevadensis TaxID=136037 RepID=A0A067QV05_ZOONE|nr:guanine nucleotide-binding protein G(q) subunit alpha-like [Zootermopsis nevadensis]KDR09594.1 Guanine nucleotide-binding protein G(q) subunit alpha [Zootermopsis nevadensis]
MHTEQHCVNNLPSSEMAMSVICWCCLSQEARARKKISDEIDKILLEEEKNMKKEFKLLLLGAGESGKSTFIKQMKIIHGSGFPEDERRNLIQVVHHNLCVAMQMLIKEMEKLQIQFVDISNVERARLFVEEEFSYLTAPSCGHIEVCKTLWADPGVRECFRRKQEFYITESATYYLPKIDLVTTPDYLPTEQDILHARVPTSGINEYSFNLEKVSFRIVDVGGQRRERKKWIHCFENVTSIIFITALSEYDQCLFEDEGENRLEESMALFQVTIMSRWFQRSSVMLFLNKKDLLQEKIMYSDLAVHFPDYDGPPQNAVAAQKFILGMFHSLNPDKKKVIYAHYTCATDTENMRFVFLAVRDYILQINLEDYNLA